MRILPAAIAAALLLAAPAYGANANFLPAQNYRAHTGPASLVAGTSTPAPTARARSD